VTITAGPLASPRPLASSRVALWAWSGVSLLALLLLALRSELPWTVKWPADLVLPFDSWLDAAMAFVTQHCHRLFRFLAAGLRAVMDGLRWLLLGMPWITATTLAGLVAHSAGGRRLTILTVAACLYIVLFGFWPYTMNTLSLVGVAVPIAIALGFLLGVLGFRHPRFRRGLMPALDVMQTIPSLAYLIPFVLLFGYGPVVGLAASVIFACPPMIRNVILGLEQVPSEVVESGMMAGCTRLQHLFWVRVPAAMPAILIGINQAIMTTLSMVILAAIVGGYDDIGWQLLSTLRKSLFGQSLLAGLVIAIVAIVFDRVGHAFAARRMGVVRSRAERRRRWMIAGLAILASLVLALVVPPLRDYPSGWVLHPAQPLNDAVTWVTANYFFVSDAIKNAVLFYFLFPLKIGFEGTVRPSFWGFALTPTVSAIYLAVALAFTLLAWRLGKWRAAAAAVAVFYLYYFGTTGTPWPVFMAAVTLLAWQVGGPRLALFALAGMAFMLLTGMWQRAMLTVQLCGAAVILSFLIGSAIGIWAAGSDRVSRIVGPICDTLQTMPQFVFLIPILMVFLAGEFSAMLAVLLYAVVPPIRYMESGLRRVPAQSIEAARSLGCTPGQLLWQVKIPLALPEIMLGLNQTIMMALYMVVVAALVGDVGLGQLVYQGVGTANFGEGAGAGIGIALIAMIADGILQALSRRQAAARGLNARLSNDKG
jgi:glycine betaine/proline transport system permease protein